MDFTKFTSDLVKGGDFGVDLENKIIMGASVITRGEALGHDLWIDEFFLKQVSEASRREPHRSRGGVQVRYGHPPICDPEMLGKQLGRASNLFLSTVSSSDGKKIQSVRAGEIRLYNRAKGSRQQLIEDVLYMADEDPYSLGISIYFIRDLEAEEKFIQENLDENGKFVSPDPLNVNNLPHTRLYSLEAIDIVHLPAANPNGLFSLDKKDIIFNTIDTLLLGERPNENIRQIALSSFNLDIDGAAKLFKEYCYSRGVKYEYLIKTFKRNMIKSGFSAISYNSAHPNGTKKAPKDTSWNGPMEVSKASVDDLKVMCAWVDSEKPDNKTSYKFPHHRQSDKALVWRAVANAAARLPQSNIPDSDVPGVQDHLGKHYREFDEVAPWDEDMSRWEEYSKALLEFGVASDNDLYYLLNKFGFQKTASGLFVQEDEYDKINIKDELERVFDRHIMRLTGKISL